MVIQPQPHPHFHRWQDRWGFVACHNKSVLRKDGNGSTVAKRVADFGNELKYKFIDITFIFLIKNRSKITLLSIEFGSIIGNV